LWLALAAPARAAEEPPAGASQVPTWIAALGAEAFEAREEAQRALSRVPPPAGIEAVVRAGRSDDPEVAWRARSVLVAWGWPSPGLIRLSERAGVDVMPLWLEVIANPEAEMDVVRAAGMALGRVDPEQGIPTLLGAYEVAGEHARYRIAVALGEAPGDLGRGALASLRARTDLTLGQEFAVGSSLCRLGDTAMWNSLVERTRAEAARPDVGPVPVYNLACLHAMAGKIDEALALLSEAVEKGFHDYVWMGRDPDLASLRGEERFSALRERAKELAGE
jgi:HEAT repeat protein